MTKERKCDFCGLVIAKGTDYIKCSKLHFEGKPYKIISESVGDLCLTCFNANNQSKGGIPK